MIRAAAALMLCAAACNAPRPAESLAPAELLPASVGLQRLPQRSDLLCFPCHSHLKFEKGPPFAHGSSAHRAAGHCNVCHQIEQHHLQRIERSACLTCHEEGSAPLSILATNDRNK